VPVSSLRVRNNDPKTSATMTLSGSRSSLAARRRSRPTPSSGTASLPSASYLVPPSPVWGGPPWHGGGSRPRQPRRKARLVPHFLPPPPLEGRALAVLCFTRRSALRGRHRRPHCQPCRRGLNGGQSMSALSWWAHDVAELAVDMF
jgi:hypothetical protein